MRPRVPNEKRGAKETPSPDPALGRAGLLAGRPPGPGDAMMNFFKAVAPRLRGRLRNRPQRRAPGNRPRLAVEALEDRALPSVGFGSLAAPDTVDRAALTGLSGNTRYVELLYLN